MLGICSVAVAGRACVRVCVVGAVLLACVAGQCAATTLHYAIEEEVAVGTVIGDTIADTGFFIRYHPDVIAQLEFGVLEEGNDTAWSSLVAVHAKSGIISTAHSIDRELICPRSETCVIKLNVAMSPAAFFQVITVEIEVIDVNEHSPVFPQRMTAINIPESAEVGSTFRIPAAEDRDSSQLHRLHTYTLLPREQSVFHLKISILLDDTMELQLVLKEALDKERRDRYQLSLEVVDDGMPEQVSTMLINIFVEDVNDNKPGFESTTYKADLPEDTPVGETVIKVTAHDADTKANAQVLYTFAARTLKHYGLTFGLQPATGVIFLKRRLDYERIATYHLIVVASDQGPESLSSHATVIVNVQDVNDSPPMISVTTLTDSPQVVISEDVGLYTFVAHVSVTDADSGENGRVTCFLNSDKFSLRELAEEASQYKMITVTELDYERQESFLVTVTCHDGGVPRLQSQVTQKINIRDANDHPPLFTKAIYHGFITENNDVGAEILTVSATDVDQGLNGRISYVINDERAQLWLAIDKSTGRISARKRLDYEQMKTIIFAVAAYDNGSPVKSSEAGVSIMIQDSNDSPPHFASDVYVFKIALDVPVNTLVGAVQAEDADHYPYNQIVYSLSYQSVHDCCPFEINKVTGEIRTTRMFRFESVKTRYMLEARAANQDEPSMDDIVHVAIEVYNHARHDVTIDFPSPANNSVTLATSTPVGKSVTRIMAHSVRSGAPLKYVITNNPWFAVDDFGVIRVTDDLGTTSKNRLSFTVSVEEKHSPFSSASAQLTIILTAPTGALQNIQGEGRSEFLILAVVLSSIFIILVLVVAIGIVCYKYQVSKS